MDQNAINQNVQERLNDLQAALEVLIPFSVAVIETHPDRDRLRKQFNFHYETLHANRLNRPLPEGYLDEAARVHRLLDSSFDRPKP